MATISKNIIWSSISASLQIYTGGIVFILMAKMMSINDFGLLSFGFSFGALLATCLDFGQSLMIMKDYPQRIFNPHDYVLNSLFQKIVFILFFVIFFGIYLNLFYENEWIRIGNRFILFAIFSAYVMYLQAVLRVKNKFRGYTITMIIYAVSISGVVLFYYLKSIDIVLFIEYMVYCKLLQLLCSLAICKEIFHKNWFNKEIQKYLFVNGWSFGAHFIFGMFYFTIDTQIIALLMSAKDVALYQSVFRIIYILLIVSDVASSVLLPYLSSKYARKENIDILSCNILYLLLILGCALFLFFISYYKIIIGILYTEDYIMAYPLVLPLSIVVLLRTAASIYGTLLTISDNQVNRVKIVFISMLLSIGLNFVLIPLTGIIAAAWVSVIVHIVLLGGYYFYSRKFFPGLNLLTKQNIQVILFTIIIYFMTSIIFNNNIIWSSLFFITWCVGIFLFLKTNKKLEVLKSILKDKGVV